MGKEAKAMDDQGKRPTRSVPKPWRWNGVIGAWMTYRLGWRCWKTMPLRSRRKRDRCQHCGEDV
jgi:hypothetical protein